MRVLNGYILLFVYAIYGCDVTDIVVLVKQVPDTSEIKIDPETGTMIREGVPSILNPFDQFALEEAVRLKGSTGGNITVVSMGPPQAKSALQKCLALGADEAILLSDRAFAGADTLATSYTLSTAIRKIGNYDMIFCGQQAIDGDTAQVGPEIAQHLGLPQIAYVEEILEAGTTIKAKSVTDDGYRIVSAPLPVLLTCTPPSSFVPASPSLMNVMKARKKDIAVWSAENLNADKNRLGLSGSPTRVSRIYSPPVRNGGLIFEDAEEGVSKVVRALRERKVIE